jgi:hypothetical protein
MTVTLFTGHRVDAPSRPRPRFPAWAVPAASTAIASMLVQGRAVSSAANGGDIMFLEACRARGIMADIFIPMAPLTFIRRSVRTRQPSDWTRRFHAIWTATPTHRRHILTVPAGANPFAVCNDAMLAFALALPHPHHLMALWDGKIGDGAGGTGDLVAKADAAGFRISLINPLGAR